MKKIIISLCIMLSVFMFAACNKKVEKNTNMSQIQKTLFFGETEDFSCEFASGEREEFFLIDGKATNNIEYGVFKVKVFEEINSKTLVATIKMDNQVKEVVLQQNPFDFSYMLDIEKETDDDCKILIRIASYGKDFVELENKSKDFENNYQKAIESANKYSCEFVASLKEQGFGYESYLTVVYNNSVAKDVYFYSYLVFGENKETKNFLINMETLQKVVI